MAEEEVKSEESGASRRGFLKTAAVAAAGAVVGIGGGVGAGVMIRTRSKTTTLAEDAIVLGEGDHLYEWIGDWAKLPSNKAFGYTQGICEADDGRILIFNNSPDAVAVFDPDGKFMRSWGSEYEEGAHGIQRSLEGGEEYLYLSLTNQNKIAKTTIDGELVWEMGPPEKYALYGEPGEYKPTNIAIAPDGGFYVGDGYGLNYIHQYTKDAEYVRSWGGSGNDFARFKQPHGIWVDTRGGGTSARDCGPWESAAGLFHLGGGIHSLVQDARLHSVSFRSAW